MQKFLFLHYGFEAPTAAIMSAWKAWFDGLGDSLLEQGHLPSGIEVTAQGATALPLAADSITGYCIITTANLEAAQQIAGRCPQIVATRVYPIK
ncbi:MAG: hypothetical protein AB8B93_11260 [Pseudomonadales bacterium]